MQGQGQVFGCLRQSRQLVDSGRGLIIPFGEPLGSSGPVRLAPFPVATLPHSPPFRRRRRDDSTSASPESPTPPPYVPRGTTRPVLLHGSRRTLELSINPTANKHSKIWRREEKQSKIRRRDLGSSIDILEECSLCAKSLSGDIFMYRGDTPFCSEECRQQQIEVDRAKHRRKKRAAAHALSARSREHRDCALQVEEKQSIFMADGSGLGSSTLLALSL